jgi:hypothetical protein
MKKLRGPSLLVLVLLIWPCHLLAVEINGKVVDAKEDTVKIVAGSEYVPNPGKVHRATGLGCGGAAALHPPALDGPRRRGIAVEIWPSKLPSISRGDGDDEHQH